MIASNWVRCSDRLPEGEGLFLVYAPSADPESPFVSIAWYVDGGWCLIAEVWSQAITHWMELPEGPEEPEGFFSESGVVSQDSWDRLGTESKEGK